MEKLNEVELMHVADLARLSLSDSEKEKFAGDLPLILHDIDKIKEVTLYDVSGDIMISPSKNENEYHEVKEIEKIGKEEALKNSKLSDGDYVVVPKVIHD